MRRLTIQWMTVGATPILVAATLLPSASSCSSNVEISGAGGSGGTTGAAGAGGQVAQSSSSSASSSGAGGVFNPTSGGGIGPQICGNQGTVSVPIPIPPAGTPAEPGQICAVMTPPVTSNTAATITLTPDPQDVSIASGLVTIDAALAADVVGTPAIALTGMWAIQDTITVSNVTAVAEGFSFDVQFNQPLTTNPNTDWRVNAKATFDLQCDPQGNDLRSVEANTFIHLCFDDTYSDVHWVTSGGICNVCDIIAEMAPSPIVADTTSDNLPLADAVRLQLRLLAKVGNAVVLLAENNGGPGMEYDWQSSAGELEQLAPDVVVWRLPEEADAALLQVAAHHCEGAAIATYEWQVAA